MDPKAALNDAQAYIDEFKHARDPQDLSDAIDCITAYTEWRRKGGFEPTYADGSRGDAVAADLGQQIRVLNQIAV